MAAKVALLGTWDTKAQELDALARALTRAGVEPVKLDLSTNSPVTVSKREHLDRVLAAAQGKMQQLQERCVAFVAVGGGTGAELALALFRHLAPMKPKFLLAPLTFDPRVATSGMLISCLFSPIDIKGSGPLLLQMFEQLARQVASLKDVPERPRQGGAPRLAISVLGVTDAAANRLLAALGPAQNRASIFHANGFGGVAMGRMIQDQAFDFLIDLTPHELTRHLIGGDHAPLAARLQAMRTCPLIALPGGLNFVSLSPAEASAPNLRQRRRFHHSANFTHVALADAEMVKVAKAWAQLLNANPHPAHLIVPMGGFSSQDGPGGCLENLRLREICLQTLQAERRHFHLHQLDTHIADTQTARLVADLFRQWCAQHPPH